MFLNLLAYPGHLLLENTIPIKEKVTVPAEAKEWQKPIVLKLEKGGEFLAVVV